MDGVKGYFFRMAEKRDDQSVLRLLADNPAMGADVPITLDCSPSFFESTRPLGADAGTIVAESDDGRIVGLGALTARNAYIDGVPRSLGYLGGLRIDPEFRKTRMLWDGYRFLGEIVADSGFDALFTTIMAGNSSATRILESGRFGLPVYAPTGTYATRIFPALPTRPVESSRDLAFSRATRDEMPEILDFLNANGKKKNFFPVLSSKDFDDGGMFSDLAPEDFIVARDRAAIAGTLALWDQSKTRRYVAAAPSPAAKSGEPLDIRFASLVSVRENDPLILREIVSAGIAAAAETGADFVVVGSDKRDAFPDMPWAAPPIILDSNVYSVSWNGAEPDFDTSRLFHLDPGTL